MPPTPPRARGNDTKDTATDTDADASARTSQNDWKNSRSSRLNCAATAERCAGPAATAVGVSGSDGEGNTAALPGPPLHASRTAIRVFFELRSRMFSWRAQRTNNVHVARTPCTRGSRALAVHTVFVALRAHVCVPPRYVRTCSPICRTTTTTLPPLSTNAVLTCISVSSAAACFVFAWLASSSCSVRSASRCSS